MTHARFAYRLLQVTAFTLMPFFYGCGSSDSSAPAVLSADMDIDTLLQQGEELYSQNCATCHYGGGGGGQNPSLFTSSIVKGSPEGLMKVILHGQRGVSMVDGRKLNGIMPAQAYLNDVEVAAIATYVRREFGKVEEPVQPAVVSRFRQK